MVICPGDSPVLFSMGGFVLTMKYSLSLSTSLAVVLLAGSTFAAEDLKSGPPVGKNIPGPFNPLHASGPDEGKKVCLV